MAEKGNFGLLQRKFRKRILEMKKELKLSVIILTKNEEDIIGDCLESVKWAPEVVVVDHYSTDQTLKIVKEHGINKIYVADEKSSFSERRDLGAQKAQGEWLLYVDADERVTPVLRKEVEEVIKDSNFSAYAIPRRNVRLTKELHFGGWWPDYVLRLMRKDKLKTWKGDLHEQPEIEGETGYLKEALVHFSHRGSLEHKFKNTINWSKIEAQKMFDAGHPPMNVKRFVSAMFREFYKRAVKLQAFRDGTEGIIEAFYQVFSVFISYARLWEMQIESKKK
ncbi:glycosyltransferase family 2 protein [Candidatus Microgenomates bacterium]|nr:MAG: glycosyltransferase family 2 protein [Candidatus Microgenomates bacterium]